uniref:DUF3363 domain-containing protein n=1 Tax=uncultured Aeromicrobium sp. TaxID=337820 RepID=UPI00259652A0
SLFLATRSDLDLAAQVKARGATWLDHRLIERGRGVTAAGFGSEVQRALDQRTDHLVREGLARRFGNRVVLQGNLIETLRRRELDATGAEIAGRTGLAYRPTNPGDKVAGTCRQRLALARALVRRPRLLVMDDATSAVDPEVEQRILRALAERTSDGSGPTVLVVAYRKATISLADEVVLLDGGRVVERGTHEELLERSSVYRDLVDAYDQAREASA